MPSLIRSAFERLPESVRLDIVRRRHEFRGLGQLKKNHALLALRLAELERQQTSEPSAGESVPDSRFPDGVRSRLCTQAQLNEPWFTRWCAELAIPPAAHRKSWEFAFVPEVLSRMGQLEAGKRGLGFGVGREPFVSLLASHEVDVVATDLEPTAREAKGWIRSGQHADSVDHMCWEEVCSLERFREHVSWRPVDMRAIPGDLADFDFCWSICSLEHLGTLEAGLEFIRNSIATLKPGGIAVHTTEFNLSSNDETVESGPTSIYRRRDMEALKQRLENDGHEVAAFDFTVGDGLLDHYVDIPPYFDEPCLRFLFATFTLTSVAIVVRAGDRGNQR